MTYIFDLDGQQLEVQVKHLKMSSELLDVTPVGAEWREIVASEQPKVEIVGVASDGRVIQGVFRAVGHADNGVTRIVPWSDISPVGGE